MITEKNPCKPDCPKRSATCHGNCPDYAEYRQFIDEVNRIRFKEKEQKRLMTEHNFALAKKIKNRNGERG